MKVVYASRTGNVKTFINKLGLNDIMQIINGSEKVNEDFVVVTYTDGYGDVPEEVEDFLSNNEEYFRGVAASGDHSYGEAYCTAADVISETYGVPILGKFEFDGNQIDAEKFLEELSAL